MINPERINSFEQLSEVFRDVESALGNADFTQVIDEFQTVIAAREKNLYAGRHDSTNSPWNPLESLKRNEDGHNRPLFATGASRESLVSIDRPRNVRDVSRRDNLFGSEAENTVFRQLETLRNPDRNPVGLPDEAINQMTRTVADAAVNQLKQTRNS